MGSQEEVSNFLPAFTPAESWVFGGLS